jgi:ABC-2 type transport system permease protein
VNELHRRLLDRSALVAAIVAPVLIAAVLGFTFAGGVRHHTIRIGVAGGDPAVVAAGARSAALGPDTVVVQVASPSRLRTEIQHGSLGAGVVVGPVPPRGAGTPAGLATLLAPVLDPGTGKVGAGMKVVTSPTGSTNAEAAASALATGIAGRYVAGALVEDAEDRGVGHPVTPSRSPADVVLVATTIGNAGKHVLDYFAASIAIIFLFMGAGLGTRALLLERSNGTLVRIAAAPVRPRTVVAGKLAAILLTSLVGILVVWAVTSLVFGAQWGSPLGVVLICVGSVLAMGGIAVFLTSFARTEREAFGIASVFGLVLALLGGNLLPPGALPPFLQVLSLGTPNGWALIGFGRLSLEHLGPSSVLGPFAVLVTIGVGFGLLASLRVRAMVRP